MTAKLVRKTGSTVSTVLTGVPASEAADNGKVLTSHGSGADPDWQDPPEGVPAHPDTTVGKVLTSQGSSETTWTSLPTNAETATKLQTARTITASGDVTGSASFDGSTNVTMTTTLSAVSRTNNTSTASPAFGGTFTAIDSVTSDSKGRVTAANTKTVTLPAAPTSVSGNAGTATKLATPRTIATSGDVTGTATSFDGSADITIPTTLATVTQADTSSTASPAFGGTFTAVDSVTRDTKGRATGINVKTVTIPNPAGSFVPITGNATVGSGPADTTNTGTLAAGQNANVRGWFAFASGTHTINTSQIRSSSATLPAVTINADFSEIEIVSTLTNASTWNLTKGSTLRLWGVNGTLSLNVDATSKVIIYTVGSSAVITVSGEGEVEFKKELTAPTTNLVLSSWTGKMTGYVCSGAEVLVPPECQFFYSVPGSLPEIQIIKCFMGGVSASATGEEGFVTISTRETGSRFYAYTETAVLTTGGYVLVYYDTSGSKDWCQVFNNSATNRGILKYAVTPVGSLLVFQSTDPGTPTWSQVTTKYDSVVYQLNGASSQATRSGIYAPTGSGGATAYLQSAGSGAPSWAYRYTRSTSLTSSAGGTVAISTQMGSQSTYTAITLNCVLQSSASGGGFTIEVGSVGTYATNMRWVCMSWGIDGVLKGTGLTAGQVLCPSRNFETWTDVPIDLYFTSQENTTYCYVLHVQIIPIMTSTYRYFMYQIERSN